MMAIYLKYNKTINEYLLGWNEFTWPLLLFQLKFSLTILANALSLSLSLSLPCSPFMFSYHLRLIKFGIWTEESRRTTWKVSFPHLNSGVWNENILLESQALHRIYKHLITFCLNSAHSNQNNHIAKNCNYITPINCNIALYKISCKIWIIARLFSLFFYKIKNRKRLRALRSNLNSKFLE